MSEPQAAWWSVLDTVFGVVIGMVSVIGAVFSWLSAKFADMDERMDNMEKDFIARNQLAATSITRLEAYHEANVQRLAAIENGTREINKKLDRIIENNSHRRKRGDDG